MSFTSIRLKWARKLLRARYFVVMTDHESAIAFEGVNPELLEDVVSLHAQTAELRQFYNEIGQLLRQHEAAVAKIGKPLDTTKKTQKATR